MRSAGSDAASSVIETPLRPGRCSSTRCRLPAKSTVFSALPSTSIWLTGKRSGPLEAQHAVDEVALTILRPREEQAARRLVVGPRPRRFRLHPRESVRGASRTSTRGPCLRALIVRRRLHQQVDGQAEAAQQLRVVAAERDEAVEVDLGRLRLRAARDRARPARGRRGGRGSDRPRRNASSGSRLPCASTGKRVRST